MGDGVAFVADRRRPNHAVHLSDDDAAAHFVMGQATAGSFDSGRHYPEFPAPTD
jgi:hypothetical protein